MAVKHRWCEPFSADLDDTCAGSKRACGSVMYLMVSVRYMFSNPICCYTQPEPLPYSASDIFHIACQWCGHYACWHVLHPLLCSPVSPVFFVWPVLYQTACKLNRRSISTPNVCAHRSIVRLTLRPSHPYPLSCGIVTSPCSPWSGITYACQPHRDSFLPCSSVALPGGYNIANTALSRASKVALCC